MRIELLGTSFTIHTDEDPERVRDLVDYYKTKVQEIQGSVSTSDPLKIAILAGLLSADEVFKARDKLEAAHAKSSKGGGGGAEVESDEAGGRTGDASGEAGGSEAEQIEAIAHELIDTLDSSLEE
jgi:cell division protein ZapA (FtsZ GTPase activity inhibitor)